MPCLWLARKDTVHRADQEGSGSVPYSVRRARGIVVESRWAGGLDETTLGFNLLPLLLAPVSVGREKDNLKESVRKDEIKLNRDSTTCSIRVRRKCATAAVASRRTIERDWKNGLATGDTEQQTRLALVLALLLQHHTT